MSEPSWTADIDVDTPLAVGLIREQFPEFEGATVEPFGSGWDNAAFLVAGRVVFRFPRRRIAAPLLEREIALLPQIAGALPLPISAPCFSGRPSERYPWPFAGYERIPGKTGCSVVLSPERRAALAEPLARFLRALHAIDPAPLVASGLQPDEIGRLDHAKRLAMTSERLPTLAAARAVEQPELFRAWLAAHPPASLEPAQLRVVHGDLYARHVLLDDGGRARGVIDWGDIHLGDPAIDLSIAHLMLPAGAHAAFRDAYGEIDERTWSVARYRAIYHAVLELDYGIRTGDGGMRRIGTCALELLGDRLR